MKESDMKALDDFNALMDRRAETLEAAGLTDMARGLRLAQVDAAKAIVAAAAVAAEAAPKQAPAQAPQRKKREWRSPEARKKMQEQARRMNAIRWARFRLARLEAQT
jgi:hypothetical protein